MSHYVNSEVKGYQSLPEFPNEAPDATVRDVEVCVYMYIGTNNYTCTCGLMFLLCIFKRILRSLEDGKRQPKRKRSRFSMIVVVEVCVGVMVWY